MSLSITTPYAKSEYEKDLERVIETNFNSMTISQRQFDITSNYTSSFLISIAGFDNATDTLNITWNSMLLYENVHYEISANTTVNLLGNFKMMSGDEVLLISHNSTK